MPAIIGGGGNSIQVGGGQISGGNVVSIGNQPHLSIGNNPSQIGLINPGNPFGYQYRPTVRPTAMQTWDGSVLNQTAPYTVYQDLGVVVDIEDLSGTALAAAYITAIPPGGLPFDLMEYTRVKGVAFPFGSLMLPTNPGQWVFLIITTTASKALKFHHYGYTA